MVGEHNAAARMANVLLMVFGSEKYFEVDLIEHDAAEEVAEALRARGCIVRVADRGGLMKIQVPSDEN